MNSANLKDEPAAAAAASVSPYASSSVAEVIPECRNHRLGREHTGIAFDNLPKHMDLALESFLIGQFVVLLGGLN
jgi:hypothetical protein